MKTNLIMLFLVASFVLAMFQAAYHKGRADKCLAGFEKQLEPKEQK